MASSRTWSMNRSRCMFVCCMMARFWLAEVSVVTVVTFVSGISYVAMSPFSASASLNVFDNEGREATTTEVDEGEYIS